MCTLRDGTTRLKLMTPTELVNVKEFAELLKVSPRTVTTWCDQRVIPCWKAGRVTRIPKTEALKALYFRNDPKREALNA
jgi:excisionase family DNA binding protein